MPLDRVLRLTVRNFSTLFLVVFGIIIPLHLIYAFFFHDVFAVRELHPAIAGFPESRLVRGVGRADVAQARVWFWIVVAAEIVLIPLMLRPLRRVVALDSEGTVPDALTAWRTRDERSSVGSGPAPSRGTVVAAVAIGAAIGVLVWLVGAAIVPLVPNSMTSFALALADGTSRAAGAAFGFTAMALRADNRSEMER